ncbi:hypothetical protein JCM8547_006353 [Rhodosporidiobolus lusitaniae]
MAWATTLGWMFISCSAAFVSANALTGVAMFTDSDYVLERWHTSFMLFRNLGLLKTAMGFLRIASYVLAEFINKTGCSSDGVAFFIRLVGSAFSTIGFNTVAHMLEELAEPENQAPKAMSASVLMCLPTALPFIVTLLFVIEDTDYLAMLLYLFVEIIDKAVKNKAGVVVLTFLVAVTAPITTTSIFATAGCVLWSLAVAGGVPCLRWLSRLNTSLNVPVNALL